ncbi:hypothetical protein [Gynuella sunshinyii]|uniref:Uncharacterized protein n=1 Tax=Gynuella sunshinyii YC6258 TaxID=1445510 RepID=A0A0C5VQT9_9GAMM|nr:hypothetical protein [Gynuella sunshinyii]AJQ95743.1 hypothetical Protein YC6258_03707 [Gynuella sunshinyii YC6258]
MVEEKQNVKPSRFNAVIKSLIISVGGYFTTYLVFAVVYTSNRVFGGDFDIDTPDPEKAKWKIINFIVGMIFPFLAGYYYGRKNKGVETHSHYILAIGTGVYVFYLAEGQANMLTVVALSLASVAVVLGGFKLASKSTQVGL